mmetsp:Transcript_70171/g.132353  ORF Transcript_70171/g.132353 Transcript_70171/m.132353 type:complete len:837 (+) Transcript_70171:134-2644(+)
MMRISPRVSDRGHMRSSQSSQRRGNARHSTKTPPGEPRRTSAYRERPAEIALMATPVPPDEGGYASSLKGPAMPEGLNSLGGFAGTLLARGGATLQRHQSQDPARTGSPPARPRSPVPSPPTLTRANSPPSPSQVQFRFLHTPPSRSVALPVGGPGSLPRGRSVALPVGCPPTACRVQAPVTPSPITPPNCCTTHDSMRVSMPTLARCPSPSGYRSPGVRCRSPSGRSSPALSTLSLTWHGIFDHGSPGPAPRTPKPQVQVRRTFSSDDDGQLSLLVSQATNPALRSNSVDSFCAPEVHTPVQSNHRVPPSETPQKGSSVQVSAAAEPAQQARLAVGSVVQVDGKTLCVTAAIGEGSFGTVWGAKVMGDDHCAEVALKEVPCRSKQALAEAAFEGSLLGALSTASSRESHQEAASRIPTLLGLQVDHLGPQTWRVRVAMSRLPGEPLWRYVERRPSPAWDSSNLDRRRCLANATNLAKELLLQLSPTLEFVSTRAYHRDVTPRNILIDSCEGQAPCFGLIDFGLAVDAAHWRLGVSTVPSLQRSTGVPAWRQAGVAGDGRYWPVSSWYMFGYGPNELERRPGLCLEYKMQLDLHSLGISALQVFVEMLPAEYSREDRVCAQQESELVLRLLTLQAAWRRYWQDASKFWQCIYDTFRSDGDFKALKAAYVRAGVHDVVRRNLTALRTALHDLRETAQADQQVAVLDPQLYGQLSALADALLAMIGTGEKVDHAAGWASVSAILNASRQQRTRSPSINTSRQQRSGGIETPSIKGEEGSSPSTPPTSPSPSAAPPARPFGSPETASPEQSASPASSASCHALSPPESSDGSFHQSRPL